MCPRDPVWRANGPPAVALYFLRSRSTVRAADPTKSRKACQRMAGSPSRSHWITRSVAGLEVTPELLQPGLMRPPKGHYLNQIHPLFGLVIYSCQLDSSSGCCQGMIRGANDK